MQRNSQRNKPNNPNTSKNHRAPGSFFFFFFFFFYKSQVFTGASKVTQRAKHKKQHTHTHTPTDEIQLNLKRKRAKQANECKGMQGNSKRNNPNNPNTSKNHRAPGSCFCYLSWNKGQVFTGASKATQRTTTKNTHTDQRNTTKLKTETRKASKGMQRYAKEFTTKQTQQPQHLQEPHGPGEFFIVFFWFFSFLFLVLNKSQVFTGASKVTQRTKHTRKNTHTHTDRRNTTKHKTETRRASK